MAKACHPIKNPAGAITVHACVANLRLLRVSKFRQKSCSFDLESGPMAYANARVSSLGATAPRQASLINGLRSVTRNAARTRLPCGCLTHKHTCQKHAVTNAHAGCQGSTSVGAFSTACSQSCSGVSSQLFASAARPSSRSASVSFAAVFTVFVSCLPWQRPCVIYKPLQ